MFGFLGAIIDLITSIIGGVFGLITSCIGSCLGMVMLTMIIIAVGVMLMFGHFFW